MNSFLSGKELSTIGFLHYGINLKISKKASIYSAEQISIGDNVRIDDFCILSGNISIGNFVHIAAYSALYGGEKGIKILDYAGISSKVVIYATNDDYTGETMTGPNVPIKYKKIHSEKVLIEQYVIVGSGCVILPGVTLRTGCAVGAMSLINRNSEPWSINAGIPFKKIKNRSKNLLLLKKIFDEESL